VPLCHLLALCRTCRQCAELVLCAVVLSLHRGIVAEGAVLLLRVLAVLVVWGHAWLGL
jgi:hypothetical protein